MTNTAIQIRSISKTFRVYHDRNQSLKASILSGHRSRYSEFWALKDVTLDIPEGKTFGFLGLNGSGKSTLLKCVARILTPNAGSITTRGRIAAMLEVGSGFHPELTGRENIYLNGTILGMSKAEIDRKFESIVDFSGVEEFIDQPVKNYSSGMYVRLGFAVAIHVEPEILLVDEVLAVGDLEFQEKCMAKFAQFREEGRTVVVVSHGLEQMRTFLDQAAWLDHGQLQEVGPATAIVDAFADKSHGVVLLPQGGTRFGSGEIRIVDLALIDGTGRPMSKPRTGDSARVRVLYSASTDIHGAVFGVSIDTRDGVWVWGFHSRDRGVVPETIPAGTGYIDVVIPKLPLRQGAYELSASIQGDRGSHMFDAWQKAHHFAVQESDVSEDAGVVSFFARFEELHQD